VLALFLPTVLRGAGLRVVEHASWRSRHHGELAGIRGILLHHTGSASRNAVDVVYRGRAGLPGPLAQLAVDRDGTWHVISAGQAWHAGSGGPLADVARNQGNSYLLGVEGVSTGAAAGDWTAAQLSSYPLGVAALLRHLRLGPDRAWFHKSWAPRRKIDIAGWPGDLGGFRATVARHLSPPPEEDIMASIDDLRRVVREEGMDARIPRQGEGQAGVTSPRTLHAWTDAAWVKQRRAVEELESKVAALTAQVVAQDVKLDAILEAVSGPKDQT
jgi:N-acetylmuramoyl-L-alanine amidase